LAPVSRLGTAPARCSGITDRDIIAIIVVALAVMAFSIVVFAIARHNGRMRRAQLQDRFGPEYDRTVESLGSRSRADNELVQRAKRVDHFRFRDLSSADRSRFGAEWNRIQLQFVDDPAVAVTAANELINEVMRARGYPVEHYEQRVADLSVEHPTVVEHYRAAHELSRSVHNGTVDTENLRQAVVHYRILFADLLQEGLPQANWQRAHA
jgi:hypothetical protein